MPADSNSQKKWELVKIECLQGIYANNSEFEPPDITFIFIYYLCLPGAPFFAWKKTNCGRGWKTNAAAFIKRSCSQCSRIARFERKPTPLLQVIVMPQLIQLITWKQNGLAWLAWVVSLVSPRIAILRTIRL